MDDLDDLLTVRQAAKELGISPQRVYVLIQETLPNGERRLPAIRKGRQLLILRQDLDRPEVRERRPGRPQRKPSASTQLAVQGSSGQVSQQHGEQSNSTKEEITFRLPRHTAQLILEHLYQAEGMQSVDHTTGWSPAELDALIVSIEKGLSTPEQEH